MPPTTLPIDEGPFGSPPKTRRRDYGFVLVQTLWRMRFDLMLLMSACVLVSSDIIPETWLQIDFVENILGIAVAFFIGFRNTQAISRWWEARTLWGAVVNQSRNWHDNLISLLSPQQLKSQRGQRLVALQVAMVWQLNFQLRNQWHRDLRQLQDQLLNKLKIPSSSDLRSMSLVRADAVQKLYQDAWIEPVGRRQLMTVTNAFNDSVGGLERIRNTPLPASYDVFVRLLNWVFGLELLVEIHQKDNNWPSTVVGALIFLCFLTAERIGAYVEGPFDADGSCFSLPLNAICLTISRNLMGDQFEHLQHHASQDPARWT